MKKRLGLFGAVLLLSTFFLIATSADARVGAGRSSGSRSSRGAAQSRPASPPPRHDSASSPSRPAPGYPAQPPAPAGGGFLRSFGAGIAGGFLGSMLFGGMRQGGGMGGGGGFGFFELIVFGGLAFFLFRWWKNRQQMQVADGPSNTPFSTYAEAPAPYQAVPVAAPSQGEEPIDVLRRAELSFDEARFKSDRIDDFFRLQAAWGNRDLTSVQSMLTLEMYQVLSADALALKTAGQINKLDNIAVREVEIYEAWEETDRVFATVRFTANLVDFTIDEKTGAVVAGSRTEPVKFQEFWTFLKEIGQTSRNSQWQLSAIEQQTPATVN